MRRFSPCGLLLAAYSFSLSAVCGGNPVQNENALAGTTAWQLSNPATSREISGFASRTSVNRGDQISLFVKTTDTNYTIDIYRMGWYGGAGARQVLGPVQLTGVDQIIPTADPATGLSECNWTNPYVLTIPNTWVSGVYLVKLTASTSGNQSYVMFVVREDSRSSGL